MSREDELLRCVKACETENTNAFLVWILFDLDIYPPAPIYPQPVASGYGYGYPQAYYGVQPSASAVAPTNPAHVAYSTYYPVVGTDPAAASSSTYDPLAQPEPVSKANEAEDKKHLRYAAGQVWEDKTLAEWPENDFRIHVGNLGKEVDDKTLHDAFQKYPTLAHWKVIRDRRTDASRGYGFVSFLDPREGLKALKEMNTKYIGQRPCKLTKSTHDKRDYDSSKKKR